MAAANESWINHGVEVRCSMMAKVIFTFIIISPIPQFLSFVL